MQKVTRPGRSWMSWTLLAGGVLTALLALGAHRRAAAGRVAGPPPGPATAWSRPPAPAPQPALQKPAVPAKRPQVEMVFALDTTGSMGGLIEGAKRKIWSIASFVARGQPTPDLRIGLIAYRDRGDAYVTRVFDLEGDLDQVYQRLRSFRADGGGDTPEDVGRAMHDSVHRISWSDRPEVVKVIYLVGDAPPHTDYADGHDFAGAAQDAARRGIEVHAIRCGTDPQTEIAWRKVALLGHGEFLSIGQDGGMKDETTPYDEKMAKLHDDLGATVMAYGAKAGAVRASISAAAAAPAPVKAARAMTLNAMDKGAGGAGDLVEGFASGEVKLDRVAKQELPAEIRDLPATRQAEILNERARRRDEIQRELKQLSDDRAKFIEKKQSESETDSFDFKVKRAMKKSVSDNALSGLSL